MSAKLTIEGLRELREELRKLPEHLADQAATIVLEAADEARTDTQAAYPSVTGNLRRGVTMSVINDSRAGFKAQVKSNARHAFIFENGTGPRLTRGGANRGRMPEAPESQQMIPIAIRARRRMQARLITLVQSTGLTVTQS